MKNPSIKGTSGPSRRKAYHSVEDEEEKEEEEYQDQDPEEVEEEPLISLEEEEIVLLSSSSASPEWIIDSGATSHFCASRALFKSISPCNTVIAWGKAKKLRARGKGTVEVLFDQKKFVLKDVLLVPELGVNLLSTFKLIQAGCQVNLSKSISITRGQTLLFKGSWRGNLAVITSGIVRTGLKNGLRGF
jgi:hypothetical protein